MQKNEEIGLFWIRFLHSGLILLPITLLSFIYTFTEEEKKKPIFLITCIYTIIFTVLNMTPLMLYAPKKIIYTFLGVEGFVFLWICRGVLSIFYNYVFIYKFYRKSAGLGRDQSKYTLLALTIGYIGGSINFLPIFNILIYPAGSLISILAFSLIACAILRYQLMDIRIVFTRFSIFVFVYTVVLGIPYGIAIWNRKGLIQLLGMWWFLVPMTVLFGLATFGPFIYNYLRQQAEERLLAEECKRRELLTQAAKGMTRIRDIDKLVGLIVHITPKTLGLTNAAIYLWDKETQQYNLKVVRLKSKFGTIISTISKDHPLIHKLVQTGQPLVYEEIKSSTNPQMADVVDIMRSLSAAVIVPASIGNTLLGFLILSDKKSRKAYSPEDITVLKTLANQAALAIENAQFYREEAERKALMYQSAILADLGIVADSMGHQIKNHLHKMANQAFLEASIVEDELNEGIELDRSIQLLNHIKEKLYYNPLDTSKREVIMSTKLLIVDDETVFTDMARPYFERKGFEVFTAPTAEEAVELIEKERPDVITLDIILKGRLDGIYVLERAKDISPLSKIVVVTGSDIPAKEKQIRQIGIDRYLTKPILLNEIFDAIKEVLGMKE